MKNKKLTRRDALSHLTKLIIASSLSSSRADLIFGQTQKTTGLQQSVLPKSVNIKTQNPDAKIIKGLIFPGRDVFMNEFGRLPGEIGVFGSRGSGCEFFFSSASSCGTQDCGDMGFCDTNSCEDQKCGKYSNCVDNDCGKQSKLTSFNCSTNNQDIFSAQFLNTIQTDPFIQSLMKELNIKTTRELSGELSKILIQRRQSIPLK